MFRNLFAEEEASDSEDDLPKPKLKRAKRHDRWNICPALCHQARRPHFGGPASLASPPCVLRPSR